MPCTASSGGFCRSQLSAPALRLLYFVALLASANASHSSQHAANASRHDLSTQGTAGRRHMERSSSTPAGSRRYLNESVGASRLLGRHHADDHPPPAASRGQSPMRNASKVQQHRPRSTGRGPNRTLTLPSPSRGRGTGAPPSKRTVDEVTPEARALNSTRFDRIPMCRFWRAACVGHLWVREPLVQRYARVLTAEQEALSALPVTSLLAVLACAAATVHRRGRRTAFASSEEHARSASVPSAGPVMGPLLTSSLESTAGHAVGPLSTSRLEATRRGCAAQLVHHWHLPHCAFSAPVAKLRVYVASLLCCELLGAESPRLGAIAVPEYIRMSGGHHPKLSSPFAVEITRWLLPTLSPATLADCVACLQWARGLLLASWALFVVFTPGASGWRRQLSTASFICGAVLYAYLASLSIALDPSHVVQTTVLFVLGACVAAPSLHHDAHASGWLQRYLMDAVLLPSYLCSGLTKCRYLGNNFFSSGVYPSMLAENKCSGVFLSVCTFMRTAHTLLALCSWGAVLLELVGPIVLLVMCDRCVKARTWLEGSLLLGAAVFHAINFVWLGAIFTRTLLLVALASVMLAARCGSLTRQCVHDRSASDGLAHTANEILCSGATASQEQPQQQRPLGPARAAALGRAVVAMITQISWLLVALNADHQHLVGRAPPTRTVEPYWPFPEQDMFIPPKLMEHAGVLLYFKLDFALVTSLLIILCARAFIPM